MSQPLINKSQRSSFSGYNLLKLIALIYFLVLATIVFLYDFKSTQHLFRVFAGIWYFDKVAHLLAMGMFSFIINLAFSGRNFHILKFRYLLGSLIVLVIATIEECSQLFISGRTFEFYDMFFNTVGIISFGEIARMILKSVKLRERELDLVSIDQ